jgi:hypothetical protein
LEKMIPRSSKRMNSVLTKGNTARPISMIESHQIITLNNIPPSLNAFFHLLSVPDAFFRSPPAPNAVRFPQLSETGSPPILLRTEA